MIPQAAQLTAVTPPPSPPWEGNITGLPGSPGGVLLGGSTRGIPSEVCGGLRRCIFIILGLGPGDPQVPTGRGSRPGFEGGSPGGFPTMTPP